MKRKEQFGKYEVLKDTDTGYYTDYPKREFVPYRYMPIGDLIEKFDESFEILRGLISSLKLMGRWNESYNEVNQVDFANSITQIATSIDEQVYDIACLRDEIEIAKYFVREGETIDDILFVEKIKGFVKEHLSKNKGDK